MNIYLISQDVNSDCDTYDSAVVVAKNEEDAKNIHPSPYRKFKDGSTYFEYSDGSLDKEGQSSSCWCRESEVKVKLIGSTESEREGEVICSSFNAG